MKRSTEYKTNPAYERAPFELAHQMTSGRIVRDLKPLRFRKKDVKKALQYMGERRWKALRALAVPPFIKIPA